MKIEKIKRKNGFTIIDEKYKNVFQKKLDEFIIIYYNSDIKYVSEIRDASEFFYFNKWFFTLTEKEKRLLYIDAVNHSLYILCDYIIYTNF